MPLILKTLAVLPICVLQGIYVKKTIIRLPEPDGERIGSYGKGKKLLSLGILGDSAAAGVGVKVQKDALLGQLLASLQDQYTIDYQLHATTGHTTDQLIERIKKLPIQRIDVVITSIGVNDVTQLKSPKKWLQQQKQLYRLIQEKFNPQLIVIAGVPPMHVFPALPNPLRWLFGSYAKSMNQALDVLIKSHKNMYCMHYDIEYYQKMNLNMAEDGFHPSKEIYGYWAKQITTIIVKMI